MSVAVNFVARHCIRLLLPDKELSLSFDMFPWFKYVPVSAIQNVELLNEHHFYWPDLDVDLVVESIVNPNRFLLVARN